MSVNLRAYRFIYPKYLCMIYICIICRYVYTFFVSAQSAITCNKFVTRACARLYITITIKKKEYINIILYIHIFKFIKKNIYAYIYMYVRNWGIYFMFYFFLYIYNEQFYAVNVFFLRHLLYITFLKFIMLVV